MTRLCASLHSRRAAGTAPLTGTSSFADVPQGHWAAGYIEAAHKAGWLRGYPDGRFYPDRPITRAEWASLLVAFAEGRNA